MKDQVWVKKAMHPNEIINTLYSYGLLTCAIESPYSKGVSFISVLKMLLLFILYATQRDEVTSKGRGYSQGKWIYQWILFMDHTQD